MLSVLLSPAVGDLTNFVNNLRSQRSRLIVNAH
jgi:hypothetical protein